jgi:hypothetical protein
VTDRLGLVKEVRDVHPYSMSWGNVADYMVPTDLHELARACTSKGDCVHFAYSMNWMRDVYGAHLNDYPTDLKAELIKISLQAVRTMHTSRGVQHVFHDITRSNPINFSMTQLGLIHWDNYLDKHLFNSEHTGGPVNLVEREGTCFMIPYSSIPSIGSFGMYVWTYDMKIYCNTILSSTMGSDPADTMEALTLASMMEKELKEYA